MRMWFGTGRRGVGFYSLGVIALLVIGVSIFVGTELFLGASQDTVQRATAPTADWEVLQKTVDRSAATERTAIQEGLEAAAKEEAAAEKAAAEKKKKKKKKGREEAAAEPIPEQASASASATASASASAAASASASAPVAPSVAPSGTTMYLTIPKLGLYDIPVLEGTSEAVLSQGVGHVPGTGYPWVAGSNTYIAGHRLGYPGTVSDHVFWGLPSLVAGDQVIMTDSIGQTYVYQVSEVLEVPITEVWVMAPVGRDVVSLQTCIENYGDYWTAGPNWYVRYIVRADRVA